MRRGTESSKRGDPRVERYNRSVQADSERGVLDARETSGSSDILKPSFTSYMGICIGENARKRRGSGGKVQNRSRGSVERGRETADQEDDQEQIWVKKEHECFIGRDDCSLEGRS